MTTREPGASDVFTQGLHCKPASTAFFANRPAAIMTDGFEVLVQLVIAEITIEPWVTEVAAPGSSNCSGGEFRN